MNDRPYSCSRREFLGEVSLSGIAGLLGVRPAHAATEPLLETTRIRLFKSPAICLAPQYVAEELLRAEGFTDVQYLQFPEGASGVSERLSSGAIDMTQWYVTTFLGAIDKGAAIQILSGVHAGCLEVFGADHIRTIRDLKGKTIAVPFGSGSTWFMMAILSYIGLDSRKDARFVEHPAEESVRLLADGKIDAFMAVPPFGQQLRAQKIGHVLLNTTTDRPYSQYFCCMLAANKEFARQHPVATKRAVRAILKADQICALEPERVARAVVDGGYVKSYDYALQTLKEVPYGRWREYDPLDTVRFYALRLHEAGVINSNPTKIIAQGTDWRFLNELKKELKV